MPVKVKEGGAPQSGLIKSLWTTLRVDHRLNHIRKHDKIAELDAHNCFSRRRAAARFGVPKAADGIVATTQGIVADAAFKGVTAGIGVELVVAGVASQPVIVVAANQPSSPMPPIKSSLPSPPRRVLSPASPLTDSSISQGLRTDT